MEDRNPHSFLIDQFKESHAHSRHLEILRAQHMTFFFTIAIASAGAATGLLGPLATLTVSTRVFLVVWIYILDLLALMVLVSIKKLGYAHAIHSRLIKWTRDKLVSDATVVEAMLGDLGNNHPLARSRFFSVQFANEAAVGSAMLILDIALVFIVFMKPREWLNTWQSVLIVACTICLLFFQGMVYYIAGFGRSQGVGAADISNATKPR